MSTPEDLAATAKDRSDREEEQIAYHERISEVAEDPQGHTYPGYQAGYQVAAEAAQDSYDKGYAAGFEAGKLAAAPKPDGLSA